MPSVWRAKTVPFPELPPPVVVPYIVFPDIINPAHASRPSLPAKLCRVVKSVPSVLRANTVPPPQLPRTDAVPYSRCPDTTSCAYGLAPSRLEESSAEKLCRFVKPVPSVLIANTIPSTDVPPPAVAPYKVMPDRTKPPYGYPPSVLVVVTPVSENPLKLCKFVKPVPSIFMANTVPYLSVPPPAAVPNKVLPDKIK